MASRKWCGNVQRTLSALGVSDWNDENVFEQTSSALLSNIFFAKFSDGGREVPGKTVIIIVLQRKVIKNDVSLQMHNTECLTT